MLFTSTVDTKKNKNFTQLNCRLFGITLVNTWKQPKREFYLFYLLTDAVRVTIKEEK